MKFSNNRILLAGLIVVFCGVLLSCGYRIIGSTVLPFSSIIIKPVENRTYEPGLQDRLHSALSREFINLGISVNRIESPVVLEASVIAFTLGAVGSINEVIKEQELVMKVDIRLTDHERVTEFRAMASPIKITFLAAGTVSETVAEKERAIEKASEEIAKETISKIIVQYAK
ncbi:MAG: hypothetical protein ISR96_04785 [Nitrospira sp.]|nr:hypothetical protein [bacterium]MBL7048818.1 hypothetical protein [Nitrospira sp.]